jgi:hypothetical protein
MILLNMLINILKYKNNYCYWYWYDKGSYWCLASEYYECIDALLFDEIASTINWIEWMIRY